MNTNGRLADLVGSDCWECVTEARTLFCLDDGRKISFLYNHIGRADESGDTLRIELGKAAIEIVGPKVKELHRDFARGKCTMIRSDGIDILSVRLKIIALIDTRSEVPGVSLGILVSTHATMTEAFAANEAFQKRAGDGHRTKIVTLKDQIDVGQAVQPAHLA
jgi:hypothetical protein